MVKYLNEVVEGLKNLRSSTAMSLPWSCHSTNGKVVRDEAMALYSLYIVEDS